MTDNQARHDLINVTLLTSEADPLNFVIHFTQVENGDNHMRQRHTIAALRILGSNYGPRGTGKTGSSNTMSQQN